MPAKHTVKIYVEGGVYHIYNRGVEKRKIFEDEYDYRVFLNCLKEALLSPENLKKTPIAVTFKGSTFKGIRRPVKNFFNNVDLLAFCLMPNHFHFLVKQRTDRAIKLFMQSITTRYSMYFNKQRKRVGPLFQGSYKASLVDSDIYLLHLSRYIHRNPLKIQENFIYDYSSYPEYVGIRSTQWIKPDIILASFQPTKLPFLKHVNSYRSFVEQKFDEDVLTTDDVLDDDTL